jgi:hypothetical protein
VVIKPVVIKPVVTMTRLALLALLLSSAFAADVSAPSADAYSSGGLYGGWLKMYDLKFDESHQIFQAWKQDHPADSLGPASDAAAYLFSELARLGVLESELFTDNSAFLSRGKLQPDPQAKTSFEREIASTDRLADSSLHANAGDTNALFAKSMSLGLRADSASLIERHDLAALKFMKDSRLYEDKVLMIDPQAYDAYLGGGVENYLLSLKSAPVRFVLKLTGSLVDREQGIKQVRMTAQYGHYLEPFAKLLLAVAALRDNNRMRARELLSELHTRFPDNQLYLRELNRLNSPSK